MTRPEEVERKRATIRRVAWGMVMQQLRMRSEGAEAVPDEDIRALAAELHCARDWAHLVTALAELSAAAWEQLHGGNARLAWEHASGMALELANEESP